MTTSKHIILNSNFINLIKDHAPLKTFHVASPLFYEGQTPIVAYLVINGEVHLSKSKKRKSTVKEGALFGLYELMNNRPSKLTAEAEANTSVCFLDKSTINEIISHSDPTLASLIKDLISTPLEGIKYI